MLKAQMSESPDCLNKAADNIVTKMASNQGNNSMSVIFHHLKQAVRAS